MAGQHITIDFDKILEIAQKGVSRAAVFLGLGLNAASDAQFRNYSLTQHTQIEIVPPNASDETLRHFKEEFGLWIVGGGLRELIETFGVFLDGVHSACTWFAVSKKRITPEIATTQENNFHWEGVGEKLALLEKRFGVATPFSEELRTINKARNCLVHRRGIVQNQDCNKDKVLDVRWIGLDVIVETPSGEIFTIIPSDTRESIPLPEGGRLKLRHQVKRQRRFQIGETLRLSPTNLVELCKFFSECSGQINFSAIEYVRSLGIAAIEKPNA